MDTPCTALNPAVLPGTPSDGLSTGHGGTAASHWRRSKRYSRRSTDNGDKGAQLSRVGRPNELIAVEMAAQPALVALLRPALGGAGAVAAALPPWAAAPGGGGVSRCATP